VQQPDVFVFHSLSGVKVDSPWQKAKLAAASGPVNGGFRDTSAPLRIYSDGINVAEICPKVYSSKLAERTY